MGKRERTIHFPFIISHFSFVIGECRLEWCLRWFSPREMIHDFILLLGLCNDKMKNDWIFLLPFYPFTHFPFYPFSFFFML
jgi:hypothetical protein